MLPANAPLSTFRVATISQASTDLTGTPSPQDIKTILCTFRAGRENAKTDHVSLLFDVDVATGNVGTGKINRNWYRCGPLEFMNCPWRNTEEYTHHPDGDIPVTGTQIPDMKRIKDVVEHAHLQLCPDVPIAGWDVVLTDDATLPICLLEANLSCGFFEGSFDLETYVKFCEDILVSIQKKLRASPQLVG